LALKHKMRFAIYVVLASLLAAAVEGYQLHRVDVFNRAIRDGSAATLNGGLPYEVLFAKAYYLDRAGKHQQALSLYQEVINEGNARLAAAAKYNSGNINLREALAKRGPAANAEALPLIELAKQSYREVLRVDSDDWDARYNLERALRLVPEKEEKAATAQSSQGERQFTTMKSYTLGLP
jgi:mxaK protein